MNKQLIINILCHIFNRDSIFGFKRRWIIREKIGIAIVNPRGLSRIKK